MSKVGLCPFMFYWAAKVANRKVEIATTIFVQNVDTRRVPTIHMNHAYPIVMTVAPVVLANLRQSQQPCIVVAKQIGNPWRCLECALTHDVASDVVCGLGVLCKLNNGQFLWRQMADTMPRCLFSWKPNNRAFYGLLIVQYINNKWEPNFKLRLMWKHSF
jgi:hypothetical protein